MDLDGNMNIKISEAKPEDANNIVVFQTEMAKETEGLQLDRPTVELGVQAVFKDRSKGIYYVAKIHEKTVGSMLTTFEWSDWRNGQVVWIQSVFVDQDYRGQRVFSKMYAYLQDMVRDVENNYCGLRLYVDKSNVAAQKVYDSLGMQNHHYDLYEWMKE